MSKEVEKPKRPVRSYPTVKKVDDGNYTAQWDDYMSIQKLMGMRTHDAANGVYTSALSALGRSAEKYGNLMSAMFAETEPRDAIEAMLIGQMTATHVAMTTLSERMTQQTIYAVQESYERSVTRLSRTYLAQMDALKKYRAKAQQTVRVERVTINEGGQAVVGDVTRGKRVEHEK